MYEKLSSIKTYIEKQDCDEFSLDLFEEGCKFIDSEGELNHCFFSLAMREMIRVVHSSICPDESVRESDFYSKTLNNQKVEIITRKDRYYFALFGKKKKAEIPEILLNYANDRISLLLETIDKLSKFTHLTEENAYLDDGEKEEYFNNVIDIIYTYFKLLFETKLILERIIQDDIYEIIDNEFTQEVFEEVFELSSTQEHEEVSIEKYDLIAITDEYINYHVSGDSNYLFNYGSSGDFRRGDGYSTHGSVQFEADIFLSYDESYNLKSEIKNLVINNDRYLGVD